MIKIVQPFSYFLFQVLRNRSLPRQILVHMSAYAQSGHCSELPIAYFTGNSNQEEAGRDSSLFPFHFSSPTFSSQRFQNLIHEVIVVQPSLRFVTNAHGDLRPIIDRQSQYMSSSLVNSFTSPRRSAVMLYGQRPPFTNNENK